MPGQLEAQPLSLSIDDTMVEKEGGKFELRPRLFGHAAHNGSIPYLSIPLVYQLSDKKQTRLGIAAGMVRQAMDSIEPDRQVFLPCDNWYPNGCVASLMDG